MTTPRHCPGYEQFKNLKSFHCACNHCGERKEVFSDELDRQHTCPSCGRPIDFTSCKLFAEARTGAPR